jgi:hypothetical protein
MFTIRNIGGVSLFLFGSTFLWLTPAFVTKGLSTDGLWWSVTRVLALATLVGFTLATWGLFRRDGWWEPVAIGSAVLGLITLVPYWVAAARVDEPGLGINIAVHLLGGVGVLVLLLVPQLEGWVDGHVMGT